MTCLPFLVQYARNHAVDHDKDDHPHHRREVERAKRWDEAAKQPQVRIADIEEKALYQPEHPEAQTFLDFLNDWTRLTTLLNEMSRSMGQTDFYPFVLPHQVVAKLHFIHLLVTSGSWNANEHQSTAVHMQSQQQNQLQIAI